MPSFNDIGTRRRVHSPNVRSPMWMYNLNNVYLAAFRRVTVADTDPFQIVLVNRKYRASSRAERVQIVEWPNILRQLDRQVLYRSITRDRRVGARYEFDIITWPNLPSTLGVSCLIKQSHARHRVKVVAKTRGIQLFYS